VIPQRVAVGILCVWNFVGVDEREKEFLVFDGHVFVFGVIWANASADAGT
jgi:hypothetical protein